MVQMRGYFGSFMVLVICTMILILLFAVADRPKVQRITVTDMFPKTSVEGEKLVLTEDFRPALEKAEQLENIGVVVLPKLDVCGCAIYEYTDFRKDEVRISKVGDCAIYINGREVNDTVMTRELGRVDITFVCTDKPVLHGHMNVNGTVLPVTFAG